MDGNTSHSLQNLIETALQRNQNLVKSDMDQTLLHAQIALEKSKFYPTISFVFHTDVEQQNSETFSKQQGHSLGGSPRLSLRSIWGTELSVQATKNFASSANHHTDTHLHFSLEQPLLKGLQPLINTQPLRNTLWQIDSFRYKNSELQSQIIFTVFQHYLALLTVFESLKIQEQRYKVQTQLSQVILKKIAMGRVPASDGIMQDLQLARLEQNMHQTKINFLKIINTLSQQVGCELEEEEPEPLTYILNQLPSESSFIEKAIDYHLAPVTEELTHIKEEELRLRDNFLWDVRIKGNWSIDKQRYFWMEDILSQDVYVKFRGSNHRYFGLFVTVPLSKDYSNHFALYQNKIIQEKKHIDLRNKEITLRQEIHNLFQQIHQWQKQQGIVEKALSFATHTVRIEEEKYLAGRSSLLDLQRMHEMEMQAALDKVSLQVSLLLARIELDYCIGLLPNTWRKYVA